MAARDRIPLGRDFTFSSRSYGWLTGDAIEVDEVDGYDVTRRRVLLDEVLLVSLYRRRRPGVLVTAGFGALVFAMPVYSLRHEHTAQLVFGLFLLPFLLAFLIHLALGTDYVGIAGRRSRARMAFNLRKERAREVFELIVREVEAAQAARRPAPAAPGTESAAS
jgi:hypothetical protein